MTIINTANGQEIGHVVTNRCLMLEEALRLIGAEIIDPEHIGDPDVLLDGQEYWMDDLEMID